MMRAAFLLTTVALLATPVLADDTIALSPAERAAAIEAAASRGSDDLAGAPARGIHGEMGVEIGSRGSHAVYGTTAVPLGSTGTAAFSFVDSRGPTWHAR